MLKPLLEKKARRRNGDFNPYYGMPAASRLPPYEYRNIYPAGTGAPQVQPQGSWGPESIQQQQLNPFEGNLAYQPYYPNQMYQQPSFNPYYMEQYPGSMPMSGGMMEDQHFYGYPQQEMPNQYPKEQVNPFQNPLYSKDEDFYPLQQMNTAITNPYPNQSFMQKNQGSNFSSVLNQFKTQEGSIDFNKMIDTAGMMLNSMNQVSNLVKGVGSIFKVTT